MGGNLHNKEILTDTNISYKRTNKQISCYTLHSQVTEFFYTTTVLSTIPVKFHFEFFASRFFWVELHFCIFFKVNRGALPLFNGVNQTYLSGKFSPSFNQSRFQKCN